MGNEHVLVKLVYPLRLRVQLDGFVLDMRKVVYLGSKIRPAMLFSYCHEAFVPEAACHDADVYIFGCEQGDAFEYLVPERFFIACQDDAQVLGALLPVDEGEAA